MFVVRSTARAAAEVVGVHRNTAADFFMPLRKLIASKLQSYELSGEVEADESYRRKLSENNPNESIVLTMNQLMLIRFGSVESWPTVSLELRRAKKLIKSL